MQPQTIPLHPLFAAEVRGIDLATPANEDTIRWIWQAIDRDAVLVLRDQRLSDAALRDFAARFGKLEIGRSAARPGPRRLAIPQIGDISNLDESGQVRALEDRKRLDSLGKEVITQI